MTGSNQLGAQPPSDRGRASARTRATEARGSEAPGQIIGGGEVRESADATSEHAWNDMFLYPICQGKNAVPVIFLCPNGEAASGIATPGSAGPCRDVELSFHCA